MQKQCEILRWEKQFHLAQNPALFCDKGLSQNVKLFKVGHLQCKKSEMTLKIHTLTFPSDPSTKRITSDWTVKFGVNIGFTYLRTHGLCTELLLGLHVADLT